MKVAVLDINGKDTGRKVELSKEVFGIEPNDHAIYLDVKQYLANQRQGTHKSKERAEIAGSTRKIKKQKGTGTARAGSIKSPVFRGGGRIFGPRPRSYSFKLNKNLKQLARKSALSIQAKDNNLVVVEDFNFDTAKTKNFTDQVTPALITRSLEILGLSLIDMRRSPDPRVDLEVALVKIASSQPPSDSSAIDLLESRVALLEETIKDLKLTKSVKDEIQVSSSSVEESSKETSDVKSAQIDTGNKENDKSKSSEDLSKIDSEIKDFPTKQQFLDSWVEELLPKLSKKARARFSAGRPVSVDENGVIIALPNEPHLRRCSELLGEVEASIKNTFGVAVPVLLSVDASSSSISPPKPAKPSKPVKNDEDLDLSGLVEADPNSGSAVERLSQAFPGAEIVESE